MSNLLYFFCDWIIAPGLLVFFVYVYLFVLRNTRKTPDFPRIFPKLPLNIERAGFIAFVAVGLWEAITAGGWSEFTRTSSLLIGVPLLILLNAINAWVILMTLWALKALPWPKKQRGPRRYFYLMWFSMLTLQIVGFCIARNQLLG